MTAGYLPPGVIEETNATGATDEEVPVSSSVRKDRREARRTHMARIAGLTKLTVGGTEGFSTLTSQQMELAVIDSRLAMNPEAARTYLESVDNGREICYGNVLLSKREKILRITKRQDGRYDVTAFTDEPD